MTRFGHKLNYVINAFVKHTPGYLLFALRDLSKACYTRGGVYKFKLILFILTRTNDAGYNALLDCNIVMLILSRDICFHRKIWHLTYRFVYLLCKPYMFKLSSVTWNHWLSLDDVYSRKWCPSETCVYMFYKEYVALDHVSRL